MEKIGQKEIFQKFNEYKQTLLLVGYPEEDLHKINICKTSLGQQYVITVVEDGYIIPHWYSDEPRKPQAMWDYLTGLITSLYALDDFQLIKFNYANAKTITDDVELVYL